MVGSLERVSSVQPLQQLRQANADHPGDPAQVDERDVPLAPLDEADVRTVQATAASQLCLRRPGRFPAFAEAVPNLPEKIFIVEVHWLDANAALDQTTLT